MFTDHKKSDVIMDGIGLRIKQGVVLVVLTSIIGLVFCSIPAFADGYYLKMTDPPLEKTYGSGANEVTYRMRSGAQPQYNYWFDGYGWTKSLYRTVGAGALENTTRIVDCYNQEKSWAWDYNGVPFGADYALEVHANYYAGSGAEGQWFGVTSSHWVRHPETLQQINWWTSVSNSFI